MNMLNMELVLVVILDYGNQLLFHFYKVFVLFVIFFHLWITEKSKSFPISSLSLFHIFE